MSLSSPVDTSGGYTETKCPRIRFVWEPTGPEDEPDQARTRLEDDIADGQVQAAGETAARSKNAWSGGARSRRRSRQSKGWRAMADTSRPANSQPPTAAINGMPTRMMRRLVVGALESAASPPFWVLLRKYPMAAT